MSTGLLLDGVFSSEAIDSSGEVLDIKGMDTIDFDEGRGVANYEHKGHDGDSNGEEIVGKVIYTHKIFKESDCENEREKLFWDKVRLPFLYGVVRLFDGAGHTGAQALAAIIRDTHANNEPIIVGFSIEGSTLERKDNRLLQTVARRVALTLKPCNKTAMAGILADPNAPPGFEKEFRGVDLLAMVADERRTKKSTLEDPRYSHLGTTTAIYGPEMTKALTAGSYNVAPGLLSGGSALQVEDKTLGARAKAAYRDWDKKTPFRKFLKARLPEVSDEFIDHFSDLVESHDLRVKKAEEVISELKKAGQLKSPRATGAAAVPEKVSVGEPDKLTIGGKPLRPNPGLEAPAFDEKKGILRTPRGNFSVYIPSRDPNDPGGQKFANIMNDPKVNQFHDYAMENWSKAHQLLKARKLPNEVAMHAVLFSQLSPNCLDAETEALTQRGWIRGFDLKKTDVLLTKNPNTGVLEWQPMTDLRLFPDYEGPLVKLESRSFYAVTTPDHRWLTTSGRGHVGEKTSATLNSGDRIHRTGTYEGAEDSGLSPDEAELLGWFVTDGHYQRPASCNGGYSGTSRAKYEQPGIYSFLSQSSTGNPVKCMRIEKLLGRLSDETTSRIDRDSKRVWNLGPKLTKMLLSRSPERCLTVRSLLDLSREALLRLREAMVLGDGHFWKGKESWSDKECLTTGRREQAEAFQALLTMTGSASVVVWRDMSKYKPHSEKMKNVPNMTGCYVVTALQREYTQIADTHRHQYTGKVGVWCPVVPNTFFVARRSGKVFVTGNTPVPMQEMMYGHLVDSMHHTGKDFRDPAGAEAIHSDWLNRDNPSQFPAHSPEHWKRLEGQLRLKNDSKISGRSAGEISSYMLANNKFKNMAKYHTLHRNLVELLARHGANGRSAVEELMLHKHQAGLWDARRQSAIKKGQPDPGPYTAGPDVPGLAPKTARYTLGMLGAGNVQVPDTHFTRYLFGLNRGLDSKTIDHLKQVLWDPKNSHILNGLDRYYAQHHDAVKHMMAHPRWGKQFESPEDAVFPAFWKNWVGIVPHEASRGMATSGHNEFTDHKPFWDAVAPYLNKNETDNLPLQTARQHHDWVQQYGEMPAQMLYFRYLLPQLLQAGGRRQAQQLVQKAQETDIDLRKAATEAPAPAPETVEFQGRKVKPGKAYHQAKAMSLLSADPKEFVAVPKEKIGGWAHNDMVRIPRHEVYVSSYPESVDAPATVDSRSHGVGDFVHHEDIHSLAHGFNFDQPGTAAAVGKNQRHSFWSKNAEGKNVYVKGQPNEEADNESRVEGVFHNLARDFFGLGKYVPRTAVVYSPRTGKEHAIVEDTLGTHFDKKDSSHRQHVADLTGSGELDRIGVMDAVMGNGDRHNLNYTFGPGGLKLIDHGLSLGNVPSGGYPDYFVDAHNVTGQNPYTQPLHPAAQKWLQGLDGTEFVTQLRRHGVSEPRIDAARERFDRIKAAYAADPNRSREKLFEDWKSYE